MYSQHFISNKQKMHWMNLLPNKLDIESILEKNPNPWTEQCEVEKIIYLKMEIDNYLYYISIYFSLKYKAYKIRYVHWFTDCSNMTVIWVNWTSFLGGTSMSWGSETLKDTSILNLMFPGGKLNVLIFLHPLFLNFFPLSSGIDCSSGHCAFTNQACFHTIVLFACCFISPGQTVQSIFLRYLLFIALAQCLGMVVNIQLYLYKIINRSHPSSTGHWNTLSAFLF